jgi:hypothetical protein
MTDFWIKFVGTIEPKSLDESSYISCSEMLVSSIHIEGFLVKEEYIGTHRLAFKTR